MLESLRFGVMKGTDLRKIGIRWLGRRFFRSAPIHHHFQAQGLADTKIVIRFWIVAGILALVGLATLKIR